MSAVCLSFDFDAMSVWFGFERTTPAMLNRWRGDLEWMHANVDGGVMTVCMHPQVIGRAHRMAMLDEFVDAALALGARFRTLGDVAASIS